MYIAQAFNIKHDWWRYIVGVFIAIMGVFIFSVPHGIAIAAKQIGGDVDMERLNDVNYLMTLFDSNLNLVFMLLPFVGGLLFLLGVYKLIHNQSLRHATTSRKKVDWKRIWFGFIIVTLFNLTLFTIGYFANPDALEFNFKMIPFLILCVVGILFIPLQTSFEEYLFRGYLMQGLGVMVRNKWFPLIVTSVIFGSLHFFNPEVDKIGNVLMFYYIGTGLFLGIITLMDEGMELALGYHAGNNLVMALLVTSDWTAFQTYSIFKNVAEPQAGTEVFLPIVIEFTIILYIFAKKYNWTNWKDRLVGKVEKPIIVEE
jgi:hypothetical protein